MSSNRQRFLKDFVRYNTLGPGYNPTPDFTITPPASVDEGTEATFAVHAFGLPTGDTSLSWGLSYINNISSGRFDHNSDSITMLNNYNAAFGITVNADQTTAISEQSYSVGLYWNDPIDAVYVTDFVTVNDTSQTPPFGTNVVINLDETTLLVAYTNIGSPGNFQQDGDGHWIIAVNGLYAPYLPVVQNVNTSWTVSGGPNNLVNEPVLNVIPNYYGVPQIVGVVIAANPGDNSVNFTFTPPAPTTWDDSSTFHQNATLVNGALASTDYGNIVTLDGVNDYVSIPMNYVDWLNNDITTSIWFKTTNTGIILGQQSGSTPNAGSGYVPAIYIGNDNKLYVSTYWHNTTTPTGFDVRLNDGQWHMLTVTARLDGLTTIYIDESIGDSVLNFGAQSSYSSNYYYFLGCGSRSGWPNSPNGNFTSMSIGSFKTWYGLAPQPWVAALYNSTKARFLAGPQTITVTQAYSGSSTGNIYINLDKFPAANRIPAGAFITSNLLPGTATVAFSLAVDNTWHIVYLDQAGPSSSSTTDVYTITWTA